MYALSVMLSIEPAHCDAFKEAALQHALNTKTNETGCLAFDVFIAEENPNLFYFHETYVNKAALEDVHKKAPYFLAFGEKTRNWILSREVRAWEGIG